MGERLSSCLPGGLGGVTEGHSCIKVREVGRGQVSLSLD